MKNHESKDKKTQVKNPIPKLLKLKSVLGFTRYKWRQIAIPFRSGNTRFVVRSAGSNKIYRRSRLLARRAENEAWQLADPDLFSGQYDVYLDALSFGFGLIAYHALIYDLKTRKMSPERAIIRISSDNGKSWRTALEYVHPNNHGGDRGCEKIEILSRNVWVIAFYQECSGSTEGSLFAITENGGKSWTYIKPPKLSNQYCMFIPEGVCTWFLASGRVCMTVGFWTQSNRRPWFNQIDDGVSRTGGPIATSSQLWQWTKHRSWIKLDEIRAHNSITSRPLDVWVEDGNFLGARLSIEERVEI